MWLSSRQCGAFNLNWFIFVFVLSEPDVSSNGRPMFRYTMTLFLCTRAAISYATNISLMPRMQICVFKLDYIFCAQVVAAILRHFAIFKCCFCSSYFDHDFRLSSLDQCTVPHVQLSLVQNLLYVGQGLHTHSMEPIANFVLCVVHCDHHL